MEQEGSSWKRTLWVMAAVQCIMMMAFTSSGPFLALYINELGVEDWGKVAIWAGIISSCNFLLAAIVSPMWGSIGDRKGRKLMVMRTTFAISIFMFLMGLAQNVWHLLITRTIQGIFSGFTASANALVATVIPEDRLGYALGWLASAGMFGTLIGPLVGGVMVDLMHSYRIAFFLTGGFALIAFFVTLIFVKERFEPPAKDAKKKGSILEQFRAVKEMKGVRTMFVVLFLAQFSVMSVLPVLPVYMKELTGLEYLGIIAGFATAATGLADLIASPFLGKRSDKIGYRKVLTICMTGAALMYLPQALAPNVWVFIAARFGLGLFIGGIMPTANALVGRLAPKEHRGKVYGFSASAMLLGSFAGPLLGGLGSAYFGIRVMLGLTCVLYLLNMIWVRMKVVESIDRC
ncbi:MFS transporter [Tumebacillus avium]|nr:MFS transporter [Tumebacillus avium]